MYKQINESQKLQIKRHIKILRNSIATNRTEMYPLDCVKRVNKLHFVYYFCRW